ncbi:MAG: TonB-dependent receptor [Bacteroidia bacterium]|nr:TonB-dependent receptor [Bacteroidia bacterium]MDW8159106.1 TonB-dependent receptor [Bacteroidia bacterium]
MKKILLFVAWVSIVFMLRLGAQNISLTLEGKVMDVKNEPLVGAAVEILKAGVTITGAYTDEEGAFWIILSDTSNLFLKVSYVGYKSYSARITADMFKAPLSINLPEDVLELEKVVVVGYGTQEKRSVTGSVAGIKAADIANIAAANLDQALQGRAAGVQIFQNSGTPGAGITVRVRGASSINSGNQPLYVIDGVPMNTGDFGVLSENLGGQTINALSDINPNDIASIEILKDAAACAIYGARASNGVVLITTKRGQAGNTIYNLNFYSGIQQPWRKLKLMDAKQYMELMNEAYINDGLEAPYANPNNSVNTDWQNEIFQTAPIGQVELSASGGNVNTRYFISGTYFGQQGIQKGTGFERFNTRMNLDLTPTDKLTIGTSMGLTYSHNRRTPNDNSIYGPVGGALITPALQPIYNPDGSWSRNALGSNPVGVTQTDDNLSKSYRILANAFIRYEIIKGLFFRTSFGLDWLNLNERAYNSPLLVGAGTNGYALMAATQVQKLLNENYFTWKRTLGDIHTLEAIAGFSFERNTTEGNVSQGQNFPSERFRYIGAAAVFPGSSGFRTGWAMNSFFSRVNYNLKDKYFLGVNFRADGSSRFGADNRYGYFPGISAGWRIKGEDFLKDALWVDDLKIRASYGFTGNQEGLANFAARGLFGAGYNYDGNAGIVPTQLPNPSLKWESTSQLDLGIDFVTLKEKISLTFDFYIKQTQDLLFSRPLPTTSGFTFVTENIGKIRNIGFDLSIRSQVLAPLTDKGLRWTIDFNFSHYANTVLSLYNKQPQEFGFVSRVSEGRPIGVFYAFESKGVNPETGDINFVDLNGDGVITADDRNYIGSPHPLFFGGLTNIFTWNNFEFNIFLQFNYGNKIYNSTRQYIESVGALPFNNLASVENRWKKPGDKTDIPRATVLDLNNNSRDSNRWLEDGSFLRVKNVVLSYNFSPALCKRLKLRSMKIFIQSQNLLTFTPYSGLDPEVNFDGTSNTVLGTDFFTYPQARNITLGVNLSF